MIIINANRDDLIEFSRMEQEIFGVDSFGLSLLEQYLNSNLLFQKIVDPVNLNIIGFTIVAIRGETETSSQIVSDFLMKNNLKYDKIAHLVNFLIRKDYWNHKIGRRFLDEVIVELKKMGYTSVILEVNTDNKRAIRLYEKNKFKIIGKISQYYNSGEDCFIMMKLSEKTDDNLMIHN